jgi:hypothetical protein
MKDEERIRENSVCSKNDDDEIETLERCERELEGKREMVNMEGRRGKN